MLSMLLGRGLLAGFMPAPPPSYDASTIPEMFESNANPIRIGMVLLMLNTAFMIVFVAAVSVVITRIEKKSGVLTYTMQMAGVSVAIFTFISALIWMAAAFRSERDIELIYLFNDLAWFMFIGSVLLAAMMFVSTGVSAFVEQPGEHSYFSRWYGYLCVWVFLSSLPMQLIFFIKTGPFAWDGLISYWLGIAVYGVWIMVTVFYLFKAAKRP